MVIFDLLLCSAVPFWLFVLANKYACAAFHFALDVLFCRLDNQHNLTYPRHFSDWSSQPLMDMYSPVMLYYLSCDPLMDLDPGNVVPMVDHALSSSDV